MDDMGGLSKSVEIHLCVLATAPQTGHVWRRSCFMEMRTTTEPRSNLRMSSVVVSMRGLSGSASEKMPMEPGSTSKSTISQRSGSRRKIVRSLSSGVGVISF